jgi:hypothetical protein
VSVWRLLRRQTLDCIDSEFCEFFASLGSRRLPVICGLSVPRASEPPPQVQQSVCRQCGIATTAPIHRVIQHRGASYLRLFSADCITTTAEACFQYTHGDWISHLPGV